MNHKGCFLAGAILLLVGLLTLSVFTITAGHFLTVVDAFPQADAIVILGGDGGSFFRVQQGVDLFNEGYAPVVVFSGGTIEQRSGGAEGQTRVQSKDNVTGLAALAVAVGAVDMWASRSERRVVHISTALPTERRSLVPPG